MLVNERQCFGHSLHPRPASRASTSVGAWTERCSSLADTTSRRAPARLRLPTDDGWGCCTSVLYRASAPGGGQL